MGFSRISRLVGRAIPPHIAQHVSPERLARFFTRNGASYQVAKEVRDMCTFSEHSMIRDPPFSRLDLISCRNVLIYLEAGFNSHLTKPPSKEGFERILGASHP